MPDAPSPRYVALLALVATAVLGIGYVLKPPAGDSDAQGPPAPAEVRRLHRLALRRSLDTLPEYVALTARDVAPYLVRIGGEERSGVVWATDFVVAPAIRWRASAAMTVATSSGDLLPASATVAGPHLPLAGLQVALPQGLAPAPRRTELLEPSEWLLAVWRDGTRLGYAPAHAAGARRSQCDELPVRELISTLLLAPPMSGGGVFDLDGRLVAVVLPCGERLAAITTGSIDTLLMRGQLLESRLLARYGFGAAALDDVERDHFGLAQGVIAREVWNGYPAAAAGLWPGDVVTALDAAPVTTPSDLEELLTPGVDRPFVLQVVRGRQSLQLTLAAAPASATGSRSAGFWLAPELDGWTIGAVAAGSAAERAGLRPGDRLLRVDHAVPRSPAVLRRLLSPESGSPPRVYLELQRGERRLGTLLGS